MREYQGVQRLAAVRLPALQAGPAQHHQALELHVQAPPEQPRGQQVRPAAGPSPGAGAGAKGWLAHRWPPREGGAWREGAHQALTVPGCQAPRKP